jgi:hypothetical protein
MIEVTACASVLHSFYNGLENIFLSIVKRIDRNVPTGDRWHRDLLYQMGKETPERKQVLTNKTIDQLVDYMGFRHFYRHSYSFSLEWVCHEFHEFAAVSSCNLCDSWLIFWQSLLWAEFHLSQISIFQFQV